jgi:hypothetical protein
MLRKLMRLPFLPALALTVTLWGCNGADRVLGPSAARLDGAAGGNGYAVVKEKDPTVGTVSAVVSTSGGRLTLGQHTLVVPAGAVDGPTTFVMTKSSDALEVSLTATQSLLNDVGSRGFRKPVTLTLSYKNAESVSADESKLRILWLKPDGTQEAQPSTVDVQGRKVTADLSHFSDYGLGDPGLVSSTLSAVGGLLF